MARRAGKCVQRKLLLLQMEEEKKEKGGRRKKRTATPATATALGETGSSLCARLYTRHGAGYGRQR